MKHPPLEILFATLLTGCGSDGTSTTSDSNTECEPPVEEVYEIDASMLDGLLDESGSIDPANCSALCDSVDAPGVVSDCSLLDSALLGGRADTGTGPREGDTSGTDGTGASTGSDGETTEDGTRLLQCSFSTCIGGRGHASLRSRPHAGSERRVAGWLAATAHAEAASIVSFVALRAELRAHGAPAHYIERAQQAALDEVRHARVMTRLARSRGDTPTRPRFDAIDVRDLESIATENAVQGCVRETWAALEACHQAQHAADPDIRDAMTRIAADETRHAELARDLHAWFSTRLDSAARQRVAAAREQAIQALQHGASHERDGDLRHHLGLPDHATAHQLLEGLRETIWA